ncbi:MAG: cupin domain-containing protein [Thermoanaerobaculia bacterium]
MSGRVDQAPDPRAGSPYRVELDAVPWRRPVDGMRYKETCRRGRRIRLAEYEPEMVPHWCEEGHSGYVLHGRLEVEFADRTVVFEAGDGIVIPGGSEHRHRGRALSDVVRVVYVEDV